MYRFLACIRATQIVDAFKYWTLISDQPDLYLNILPLKVCISSGVKPDCLDWICPPTLHKKISSEKSRKFSAYYNSQFWIAKSSIWGKPHGTLVSTGRPQVNLASVGSKPYLNLVSVRSRPHIMLASARGRPHVNIVSVGSRPHINLVSVGSRPDINLESVGSKPQLNLVSVESKPYINLVSVRSRLHIQ